MTAALWQSFCAAAGVPESTVHEAGAAGADELALLTLAGIKSAASSKRTFDTAVDPLPQSAATA